MFTAEKHFINVIRPQPSSSPFRRPSFLFPSVPFRLLFPFLLPLARYLAFTLSFYFSFPIFLSSCLYSFPPPPLPAPISISVSPPLYSLPLWHLLSVRFCFPSADLFLFSQRRAEREYFLAFARWVWYRSGRVSFKRETVGRNDDAVDDAVCGDSSSSRKRTWYILPGGQMCTLLGSSGIINDTHRFL